MKPTLEQILPIIEVSNGCIITTNGDFTIGFELTKPEIFCQGNEALTTLKDT